MKDAVVAEIAGRCAVSRKRPSRSARRPSNKYVLRDVGFFGTNRLRLENPFGSSVRLLHASMFFH